MDASGYDYELLAVDDASTDATLARLYEGAPRFPQMEIVPFRRNGGSGVVRRWAPSGPAATSWCGPTPT